MANEDEETETISMFLRRNGVSREIVAKLEEEKVTEETIHLFTKEDLLSYGVPLGDVYLLFDRFISEEQKNDRKRRLRAMIQNVRSGKEKGKAKKKKETVDINLKWHHYSKKTSKHVMMRAESGGGNQTVPFNRYCNLQELTEKLTSTFFPNGFSKKLEDLKYHEYLVTDAGHNPLPSNYDGNPFTIDLFLSNNRYPKPVVILLTKKMSSQKFILSRYHKSKENEQPDENNSDLDDFQVPHNFNASNLSVPGGASRSVLQERRRLINQQNEEFNESLAQDRRKMLDNESKNEELSKAKALQKERGERVLPEPSLMEPNTVISVRLHNGTQRRIFSSMASFVNVYDWIGSLNTYPTYFTIHKDDGDEIPAWANVAEFGRMVLFVKEFSEKVVGSDECAAYSYDAYSYADAEQIKPLPVDTKIQDCSCNLEDFLKNNNSPSREDHINTTVIAHRRPTSFWRLLFKQNLDASKPFKVVWAGEPGVDDGGPFREFLLQCMNFPLLPAHFFGAEDELMFTSFTDQLARNEYRLLGELSALAILNIGRGPQCLHPDIVDEIFSLERKPIQGVINGEYDEFIRIIRSGDPDPLHSANIMPSGDVEKDIASFNEYYCIYSRLAGIDQFRKGIASVDKRLLEKGCCLKNYFLKENREVQLEQVRSVMNYIRMEEEGSNDNIQCEDALAEFELFLSFLNEGKYEGIGLKHFLIFTTGMDRVPIFGLPKKIDVHFVDDRKLTRASTCGLYLLVPKTVTHTKIAYAVQEGGGYGSV